MYVYDFPSALKESWPEPKPAPMVASTVVVPAAMSALTI